MPNPVFPRSTPSAQGVDPTGVEAFLDQMATATPRWSCTA